MTEHTDRPFISRVSQPAAEMTAGLAQQMCSNISKKKKKSSANFQTAIIWTNWSHSQNLDGYILRKI